MKQIISAVVASSLGLTVVGLFGTANSNRFLQPAKAMSPTLLSQLNSKLNLPLLAKATAAFVQSDRYRTESEMRVKASSGGTDVTSVALKSPSRQTPEKK